MKSLINTLFCFVLLFSLNLHSQEFEIKIRDDSKIALQSIFGANLNQAMINPNFMESKLINGKEGGVFLYNVENINLFETFGEYASSCWGVPFSNCNSGKYFSVADSGDINAGMGYQCVGFVKSITTLSTTYKNYKSTSYWTPGEYLKDKIIFTGPIKPGESRVKITPYTPIATFNSNNKYWGHVAIFIGVSSDYKGIYVIDQNWTDLTGGINVVGSMSMHYIPFLNKSGVSTSDASDYRILKVKY